MSFEHDGTLDVGLLRGFVEDGDEDGSVPVPQTFNFTVTSVNHAPAVAGDLSATVAEGGTYQLTTADLDEADPDDSGTGLTYTVTSQTNGTVLVSGITASGFSAQDVIDGLVSFKHDGSETENASFRSRWPTVARTACHPRPGPSALPSRHRTTSQPIWRFHPPVRRRTSTGNALTLNATDNLDGGDGFDSLVLFGGGTFDLNSLAGFANFEEVRLVNVSTRPF